MITFIAMLLSIVVFTIAFFLIPVENHSIRKIPFVVLTITCFVMAWLSMQFFSIYFSVIVIVLISTSFSFVFYNIILVKEEALDVNQDANHMYPIYADLHVQSLRSKKIHTTNINKNIIASENTFNEEKWTDQQIDTGDEKPLDVLYAELLNEKGKDDA